MDFWAVIYYTAISIPALTASQHFFLAIKPLKYLKSCNTVV